MTKISVLDDNTRDADVIGEAATAEEAMAVFTTYLSERMTERDMADIKMPTSFEYRSNTSVASPAWEPYFA